MTYEEFKKEFRQELPTAPSRLIKEMHKLIYPDQYTIADTPPPTKQGRWNNNQKEEGINPMNTESNWCTPCAPVATYKMKGSMANAQVINAAPVEATQRDYTSERVKAIGEKHAQALRTQFHMDTVYPQTFLQLEALIKAGDYTVSDKAREDDAVLYNTFYGVHFGKPADKAGYEAAKAVLKTAAQKALDGATLKPLDQLEAVIDDFEAWAYTPVVLQ